MGSYVPVPVPRSGPGSGSSSGRGRSKARPFFVDGPSHRPSPTTWPRPGCASRKRPSRPAGSPRTVRLLAVSKTFSLEHIRAAVAAGQEDFGENRVQEALQKIDGSTDLKIRWHLIGTLQSNKVRKAVSRFSAIHSVDSLRLLETIDAAATEAGSRTGSSWCRSISPERRPSTAHRLPKRKPSSGLPSAATAERAVGLMTIPPFFDEPEDVRPYFARLPTFARRAERGAPASDAAGTVYGNEPRFRHRRAGRGHDGAARHGHFRETFFMSVPLETMV